MKLVGEKPAGNSLPVRLLLGGQFRCSPGKQKQALRFFQCPLAQGKVFGGKTGEVVVRKIFLNLKEHLFDAVVSDFLLDSLP